MAILPVIVLAILILAPDIGADFRRGENALECSCPNNSKIFLVCKLNCTTENGHSKKCDSPIILNCQGTTSFELQP